MIERFIIQLPVSFDNFEYIGNPLLKPETNNEFDLVLKYKDYKWGVFELTGFYSLVENYIDGVYLPKSIVKPLTAKVYGVKKFENTGTASLYGFEYSYKSPIQHKLQGFLTAAYTFGVHKEVTVLTFDATNNPISSQKVENDPLSEIPPMNINFGIVYELLNGIIIPKINMRYMAKQNKISTAQFEIPTDAASVLNVSLTYKQSQALSIVGGITNLMNSTYYEHLNRRILGTSTRMYEPGRVFYINMIFNL